MSVRVLVVDDHPLFRDGVVGLLAAVPDMETVGTAGSGAEAVREATLSRPDVVLMDLNLPDVSGVEATRRIAAACPGTAVLALTMLEDDASVLAAVRAGARGYLLKGAGQEELLAAVRTAAAGGAVFGGRVADQVRAALAGDSTPQPARHPGLTERESAVLRLLLDGRDSPAIARELKLSTKTVRNHVSNVLLKTGARDRVDLVLRMRSETARPVGRDDS